MKLFPGMRQPLISHLILAVFLAGFCLPLVLTPVLLLDSVFPRNKKVERFIRKLTRIEEPVTVQMPRLTAEGWFSGSFQEQFGRYFSKNFMLRKFLIQLSNQMYYTLFKKSYMLDQTLIVGKEEQLFELMYIQDYCRMKEPLSPDRAEALAQDLALLQAGLKKRGAAFLVLITPSKASLYPQYIPDAYLRRKSPSARDYENMLPLFRKYGVQHIDGHEITRKAQEQNQLPLFCRGGTHWNELGAFFTVSELIGRAGELKGRTFARLTVDEVKVDRKPRGSDRDLAQRLHLLFPPYDYIVPHPVISVARPGQEPGPDIAVVGGSFNHIVLNMLDRNRVFRSMDFYYYYHTSLITFPKDAAREAAFTVERIDWERDFFMKDLVVLEINESAFQEGHVRAFLDDALKRLTTPTL